MSTEEWQTYCPSCQALRLGRREMPNHLLHFIITFFTCGLWGFVWFVLWLVSIWQPYVCTVCGSKGINR